MTALREAAQQALAFTMRDFATMRDFEAARTVLHDDLRAALKQEEVASAWLAERKEYWRKEKEKMQATNDLRAALAQQAEPVQEPVACEPQYANDDGWCDWVCPKPIGYLMQCCGCGLIHEVESRVAKYKPRPSEEFEAVGDPDLQVQWRMKRRDDISPKQKTQEPVAWRFEARHIDTAWVPAVSLKRPGPEHKYMRNVIPLYTTPPQRKPLTEEEIDVTTAQERDALLDHIYEYGTAAEGVLERIRKLCRAIERAHGIKE